MKPPKLTITISLIYLSFVSSLFAFPVDAENISPKEYFNTTLTEIQNAKSSILVTMYLVSVLPNQPDSQPNQLLDALVKAKTRGVEVKVILDQNIDFESESTDQALYKNKNQEAFEYLKKHDIPVFFDSSEIYTHAKTIVIDNETVILGSTNWSKAALTRNNEANVLIRSKALAQDLLNDLNQIKLQENVPQVLTPSVPIPLEFITKKNLLGEMVSQSDERTFDTYLYFLKEFNQNKNQTLTLDYDNLAKSLNLNHMTREDYRRQITKVLLKLKDKYKLIDFKSPRRNQDVQISLLTKNETKEDPVQLPSTYWRYHWNQSLSFPAKALYLVYHHYSQNSPSGSFAIGRKKLSELHSISESFISQGNKDLRKLNLLNIRYGALEEQRFNEREPNIYTLKELYNPEDLKKALEKLSNRYGKDKLHRAVKTASLVFEENNPKTIQTLIDLENQYGQPIVNEASEKIAQKSPDNPKRSAGYLINTIKSMAKERQPI